jgi:hypothetical protein
MSVWPSATRSTKQICRVEYEDDYGRQWLDTAFWTLMHCDGVSIPLWAGSFWLRTVYICEFTLILGTFLDLVEA